MSIFHKSKKQRESLNLSNSNTILDLDSKEFIKFVALLQKSLSEIIRYYQEDNLTLLSKSMAVMIYELHHMAAQIGLPFEEILHEVHKELLSERASSIYGYRIDGVLYPRNNSEGMIATLLSNRRSNHRTVFRELNLLNTISFYDSGNTEHRNLSSSINSLLGEELGIGLAKKYFEEKELKINISRPCTQGTHRGERLDCWMEVSTKDEAIFYQTEIKNWSSHSLRGRPFPEHGTEQEIQEYRKERWQRIFDDHSLVFREPNVQKVLIPMSLDHEVNGEIKPLLIVWDSMHPNGKSEEFFSVPVQSENFKIACIFSMSTYIRNLINQGRPTLDIELPNTAKKMFWAKEIYELISYEPI